MHFRQADGADLLPLAELWAQAFPGERTVADRMRQLDAGIPYGGLGCSWLTESDGRLAGAYRAYRLTQHLAGTPLPVLGVAAVATAPTARRRGVGRAICQHALRLGRERGDVASLLYPFRPSFYRAFGWGLAGELHAYRFSPAALPLYGEAVHVRAGGLEDRDLIAACYARVAARSHGLIARDRPIWSYHLDRIGVYPYLYDRGGVRGYLLARFERGPTPESGTLVISELVAEDEEGYRALLGWIAAQRDQVRDVSYDARPDERLDLRLSDPRPPLHRPARSLWFPTARRIRGPMLRLLDIASALESRTRWGDGTVPALTLALEVHDAELPENRGPWRVLLEEGRAYVEPADGARGADAMLTTDAATFSEIYTGTLPPSAALRLGLAEGAGAIDALDRLFALEEPFWLLDEF